MCFPFPIVSEQHHGLMDEESDSEVSSVISKGITWWHPIGPDEKLWIKFWVRFHVVEECLDLNVSPEAIQ